MNKKTIVWVLIILAVVYLIVLFATADNPFLKDNPLLPKPRKGVVVDPDDTTYALDVDMPRIKSRRIGQYWLFFSKKIKYVNNTEPHVSLKQGMKVCYIYDPDTKTATVVKIKEEGKKCDE